MLSYPSTNRSISIEGLKTSYSSSCRYRNRRIGEFLKELYLTEGRNTGFQKIRCTLQSNGSLGPLFETDRDVDAVVMQLAAQNPANTVADMAATIATSKATFERALRRLKATGRIERVGAQKNGQWVVSR